MPEAVVVSASLGWPTMRSSGGFLLSFAAGALLVSPSLACPRRRSSGGLMLSLVAVTVWLPFSGVDLVRERAWAVVAGASVGPTSPLTRRGPTLHRGAVRGFPP